MSTLDPNSYTYKVEVSREWVACPICSGTGRAFCPKCENANRVGGTSVYRDLSPHGKVMWLQCDACRGWGYDRSSPPAKCWFCKGDRGVAPESARGVKRHEPVQRKP